MGHSDKTNITTSAVLAKTAELPLAAEGKRARLDSIDILRGLAIILMALDHSRDFLGVGGMNPSDITQPALFTTRWMTHFCAPAFCMLAGISAYLYGSSKGRSKTDLTRFLLTRGFWLILIEFTIVRFGWNFSIGIDFFRAAVIWSLGISMIVMAVLIHLPRWAIAVIGLAMIFGHNLLDGIQAENLGSAGWIWNILHQPGKFAIGGSNSIFIVSYPMIPWPGIMAIGYALGPIFKGDPLARRRLLLGAGAAVTVGFVLLRFTNFYGNPVAWSVQDHWYTTLMSFLNCEKYPPSLLYLMMTLGPVLILLAVLEQAKGWFINIITTFGRVPFLFYVVHLPFIHILAAGIIWFMGGDTAFLFSGQFVINSLPENPVIGIPGVYAVWLVALVALYPLFGVVPNIKGKSG